MPWHRNWVGKFLTWWDSSQSTSHTEILNEHQLVLYGGWHFLFPGISFPIWSLVS